MIKYRFILFFWLLSLTVSAQVVPVPDTALRNFLAAQYPTAFDNNQELILSEAAQITGTIDCSALEINSLEAIQHFTGITALYAEDNYLTTIPDISGLTNLVTIKLGENQISTLPSFNSLTNLTTIELDRNELTALPDFSGNPNLKSISAHNNNISELPSFHPDIRLVFLNLAHNNFTELPNIPAINSLESLLIWSNDLTALPDLTQMPNLRVLEAAYNDISDIPAWPPTCNLETIHLEFNNLTSFPDFRGCSNLIKLRVYNNHISFEDLLPYTSSPLFSTLRYIPQSELGEFSPFNFIEADSLSFDINIDLSTGNSYSWFHEGDSLLTSDSNVFFKPKASFSDSGYYYLKIRNSNIPDLTITTKAFFVNILPCVNPEHLNISTTNITCINSGSLNAEAYNQAYPDYIYQLNGVESGREMTSTDGSFNQLTEKSYRLTILAPTGCKKVYPEILKIEKEDCEETFITPNGDGVDDYYFIDGSGSATISDKFGNKVKDLSLPSEWDGSLKSGKASPGYYLININNGEKLIRISIVY